MDGEILIPGAAITRDIDAKGGRYDYDTGKRGFESRASLHAFTDAPWATHCGIEVRLQGAQRKRRHQSFTPAPSLPSYREPKVPAASRSGRSKRKQQEQWNRTPRSRCWSTWRTTR
eukprot:7460551-Pyramimonas_sp.AAC.1